MRTSRRCVVLFHRRYKRDKEFSRFLNGKLVRILLFFFSSSYNVTTFAITGHTMWLRGNKHKGDCLFFSEKDHSVNRVSFSYHLAECQSFTEKCIRCRPCSLYERLIVSKVLETASSGVNPLSSPFFFFPPSRHRPSVRRPLVALLRFGAGEKERRSYLDTESSYN